MTALCNAFSAAERKGIRREWIPAGDLRMHTLRYGHGFPLLLLHGWPEFCLVWQPMMELLGDSFELIAPDLRGFGDTGKPRPGPDPTATADQHATDILGLADNLGLGQFGLVSGDVGAYVAQALCHQAPARIAKAFYFCTPYPGIGARYGEPGHLVEVWYQYFQQLLWAADLVASSRKACRLYLKHFLDHWSGDNPAVFAGKLDIYVDNYLKPGNMQGGFDWYLSSAPTRRKWLEGTLEPRPPITVPTRLLWGRRDPLIKPAWSDRLGEYFTDYHIDFVDAGHYVHAEIPEEAAREVRSFFAAR